MLCFACYRTFTPHANLSILLPTLHSRTCASQLCTVQRLTSLYANLGYRTHRQMCANFRLEPLKLCEGQLTPHPSTHANFSQCSPHSVCVCECRGIGQRSAVPMRLPTLHAPICVRLSASVRRNASLHLLFATPCHVPLLSSRVALRLSQHLLFFFLFHCACVFDGLRARHLPSVGPLVSTLLAVRTWMVAFAGAPRIPSLLAVECRLHHAYCARFRFRLCQLLYRLDPFLLLRARRSPFLGRPWT